MARTDPQVNLRIPRALKESLEEAAKENKRSLTAEIVSRLEESLEGPFEGLSKIGFIAMVQRLEASVYASENLFMRQRDTIQELKDEIENARSKK